eukprot:TRINITY_DN1203_c0_g1_i1.p1 TRINITY_DN1203_c0_g1~~TRINITY_DN1203_c0_g1_i1.p1  ORF type:complete len:659 (-),score=222.09 TRINITY_DN1203_c0_g1_i1:77-2053(-)
MATSDRLNLTADYELSSAQEREKREVEEQFYDFWKTNIRLSKGFSEPFFSRDEITEYLSEAAEDIVIIRSHISKSAQGDDPMWNVLCGNAREYLWNLSSGSQHPFQDTSEFVRSLVKTTFKDTGGFREGLTEQVIDEYINEINEWRQNRGPERVKKLKALETEIDASWNEIKGLWESAKARSQEQNADLLLTNAQAVISHLNSIKETLKSASDKETDRQTRRDNEKKWRDNYEAQRKTFLEEEKQKIEEQAKAKQESEAAVPEQQQQENQTSETESPAAAPSNNEQASEKQNEEASSNNNEEDQNKRKYELKIHEVKEEVEGFKTEIKNLEEAVSNLDTEALLQDKGGEKKVEALRKQCMAYGESLLKELFKLDSLVEVPEDVRQERKEQVKYIQSLMSQLDENQSKLKGLLEEIRSNAPPQEESKPETKSSEAETPSQTVTSPTENVQTAPTATATENITSPSESNPNPAGSPPLNPPEEEPVRRSPPPKKTWRDMKLKPKFEVKQVEGGFIISSFIPGMSSEDLVVSLQGDHKELLSIKGFRGPTQKEEAAIRAHLKTLNISEYTNEDDAALLYGAGRYGSFNEVYKLPEDAERSGIEATYERGVLRVVVPRRVMRRAPVNPWGFGGHQPQRGGYRQPQRGGNPFGGFFQDSDMFW